MFPLTYADIKCFKSDLNVVHARDLNFVLRSEIFVHYDGQLRAPHLILECTPSYTSYQDLGQALTVGSPLLSYLNMRLHNFLPRGLMLGEAWRLGPCQIRKGSLLPVRDSSADRVFHSWAEHIPVEEPAVAGYIEEPVVAKLVDSSYEGTELEESLAKMVVRSKMTVDHFLPEGLSTFQQ